jgi:hypothetical protein
MNPCVICQKPIDEKNWNKIKKKHKKMLKQVNNYGVDSLTENQQVLYMNLVHNKCYKDLS